MCNRHMVTFQPADATEKGCPSPSSASPHPFMQQSPALVHATDDVRDQPLQGLSDVHGLKAIRRRHA